MMTKNELLNILTSYLKDAKSDKERDYALKSFAFYIKKNYNLLDEEARKAVGVMGNILLKTVRDASKNMTDGESKRKIERELGKIDGGHFVFSDVVKFLCHPPDDKVDINAKAEKLFVEAGQNIINFLYDVSKNSLKKDKFFIASLFYSAVDELLVAFHLAQRGFTAQSLHHSRTVLEIVNLIKLFEKDKQWFDLWISDDEKKKRKEFKPSEVRKKLGKETYDPVYGALSDFGTHITFNYLKPKTTLTTADLKSISAKITLGGNKDSSDYVWTSSACIHSTLMLLLQLTSSFSDYLIENESIEVMSKMFNEYKKFILDDFIVWAKENGLPTEEMEQYVKGLNLIF